MDPGLSPAGRSALSDAGDRLVRSLEACSAALAGLAGAAGEQRAAGASVEEIAAALDVTVEFATALVSADRRPTVRLQVPPAR